MADLSLRSALRSHTQALHTQLDETIGSFNNVGEYRSFLVRSYQFRGAAEPVLRGQSAWPLQELTNLIRQDMDDLGEAYVPVPASPSLPTGLASAIGALYVLEGSSVGAHLLFARVQRLNLGEQFGARHLAAQSGDATRWKRFIGLLGSAQLDHTAALHAAGIMFELALSIYSEPVRERA